MKIILTLSLVIFLMSCKDKEQVSYDVIRLAEKFENLDYSISLTTIYAKKWDSVLLLNPYEKRKEINGIKVQHIIKDYNLEYQDGKQIIVFANKNEAVGVLPVTGLTHDFYFKVNSKTRSQLLSGNICLVKEIESAKTKAFMIKVC